MSNLLADGVTWLDGVRHAKMTTAAVYSRGAASAALSVTFARREGAGEDISGGVMDYAVQDIIIRQADLILSSVATEPARGDKIVVTRAGGARTYQVLDEAGGAPCFEYEMYDRTYRIHTKLI